MSETVTGILRLARLSCAALTWDASCEAGRTPSRSGSEPNWTARVTNLALGLEWRVEKSASRRLSHLLSPSKPNCARERAGQVSILVRATVGLARSAQPPRSVNRGLPR